MMMTTLVLIPPIFVLLVVVKAAFPDVLVIVDVVGVGRLTTTTVVFEPLIFVLTVEV